MSTSARIAVLIPCYNEEAAIAKVVNDFKITLPNADVYVYDNNSRTKPLRLLTPQAPLSALNCGGGKGTSFDACSLILRQISISW